MDAPEPAALLCHRQAVIDRLRSLCAAGLSIQAAVALFRHSTSADATFLARTVGLPLDAQASCDSMVSGFLQELLSATTPFPDVSITRLFLPLRMGGLGFSSQRLTADHAASASWMQCLPDLLGILGIDTGQLLGVSPAFSRCLQHASSMSAALDLPALDATTAQSFSESYTQRAMAMSTYDKTLEEVRSLSASTPYLSALQLSSMGPGTGAWTLPPRSTLHALSDSQYRVAFRLRFGIPFSAPSDAPSLCQHTAGLSTCNHALDPLAAHALSCCKGGGVVARHNAVRDTLFQLICDSSRLDRAHL